MSYILDALRRADAERERGAVPGLHTQGSAGVAAGATPASRAGAIGLGAGSALVLLALGLLVWRGWPGPQIPGVQSVAVVAPPVVVEPVSPVPVQPPAVALPAQPVQQVPAPAPAPVSRKRSVPATGVVEPPRAAAASAPAAPPVSTLAELPDDIRRQLPALAIGGSAYSTSPASRFVIVNGQLFHEGDALAPGLILEQIRLKSAVLGFKGYRYGINF